MTSANVSPIAADPNVLSVENLTVSFRIGGEWRPIVRDISLSVAPGETVSIVGESGSGKSVTSLAVMRLLPKHSSRIDGKINLLGRDLLSLSDDQMRRVRGGDISMIFQDPMSSLNPLFPIGDQIGEALKWHGTLSSSQIRTEVIRLLDRVRIPAAASRLGAYPHQLSGGMRQRVMIAMALAARPKLLIADEPTTALDVTIQAQILELIKELQHEENMGVLFVTHDMGVVAEIADRTIVMYRGATVEADDTRRIFAERSHPYTRALLSAVPTLGTMPAGAAPTRFPVVDYQTGDATPGLEITSRTMSFAKPLLEVKGLCARFDIRSGFFGQKTGAVHAVENVSFDLAAGETLSLVGESGSGKSTTGRCITRLMEPSSGNVRLGGVDVLALDQGKMRAARRSIQMVFQDPFASLNPRKSILSILVDPYLTHGLGSRVQANQKAAELMRKVGLDDSMLKRFPNEFSGGQRQRICIARALMLDPKVIVADEAVSALDASIKAQVCNLMLDLQESMGLSYLFISHDMAVVERMSHRVAVMYLGEIVEIGPRAAIFGNPQHPYTQKLIEAVPIPDPSRRDRPRDTRVSEIKSPIRPVGYKAPRKFYREVSAGHFVQAS